MTSDSAQHPDAVELVAYAEGGLLEFERADLEPHLADCPDCRALLAELVEATPVQAKLRPLPAATASTPWGRNHLWKGLLAAALLLILARILPWGAESDPVPTFQMAVAETRQGVFEVHRGAVQQGEEFYIGVRLQGAGWVRLVGFDQNGRPLEIPLDEKGTTSLRSPGSTEYVFGPYPLQLAADQRVHTVATLVSEEQIPWPEIDGTSWSLEAPPQEWNGLAAGLGASVQHEVLETERGLKSD